MQREAWYVELSPLWATPDVRGTDRILPGVAGVKAYRRRLTVTRYSLPFYITGQYDRLGNVTADPFSGLAANLAWLYDELLLPLTTGDGTQTAVWTPPGQSPITAAVHVLGIPEPSFNPAAVAVTTLELSVPGGDLHL